MIPKITLLAIAMLLADCGDGGATARINQEIQQRAAAEEQRAAAEERQVQAQQQARAAEQSRSKWQTISFGLGVSAFALLLIGTALGSRTRTDATKRKR